MKYQDRIELAALAKYAAAMNARAKRFGAPGELTAGLLQDRILESGGRCEWCGAALLDSDFELDHAFSLRQRGSNNGDNLVVACPPCNRRKAEKHPARFAAEMLKETGVTTPLISRLLQHYDIEGLRQLNLFDEGETPEARAISVADDVRQVPPYNWNK